MAVFVVGCSSEQAKDVAVQRAPETKSQSPENLNLDMTFAQDTMSDEIKIASYNLLNLFDTVHDVDPITGEDKGDYTFLEFWAPGKYSYCKSMSSGHYRDECFGTNWNDERLAIKLRKLKKGLMTLGSLPDVLAVQEIENDNVAAMFAKEVGYDNFQITHSPDRRGIDVAIFYRTEKLTYRTHEEVSLTGDGFKSKKTRNILRVEFEVKGLSKSHVFAVYANHWPSQGNSDSARIFAAETLKADIDKQVTRYGKNKFYAVALGDFNTLGVDKESPNAIVDYILDESWKNHMVNTHDLFSADTSKVDPKVMEVFPAGTYFYSWENSWDILDKIMFTQNFHDGADLEVLPDTYRIVASQTITEPFEFTDPKSPYFGVSYDRVPFHYEFYQMTEEDFGYSDHLPVYVKVKIQ